MSSVKLEDFLPVYPDPYSRNFPEKMFRKKEFYDLKLEPIETVPKQPGTYLNHQKILSRFVSPYTKVDRQLLFHGLGSGKCVLPHMEVLLDDSRYIPISCLFARHSLATNVVFDGEGYWSKPTKKAPRVKAYDFSLEKSISVPIKYFYHQTLIGKRVRKITFDNGHNIIVTCNHKLFDSKRRLWVKSEDLTTGNSVLGSDLKSAVIMDVENILYSGRVYDLEIEHYHNYIINGVFSHNTCTSIAIEEQRKQYLLDRGFSLRKAIVLVKGATLIKNFQNELATKCTFKTYQPNEWTSQDEYQRKRNKIIKKAYQIFTFGTFLNKLGTPGTEAYISKVRKNYDDTLIIVDEVQNIRIQLGQEKATKSLYTKMHSFLHAVQRCKILLLTATPIWDQANEIASILNLLLPLENQLPTGRAFDAKFFSDGTLVNVPQLKARMNGIISYVRSAQTTAKIIEEGQTIPWFKHLIVYPSALSNFQYKALAEAGKREKLEYGKEGGTKGAFHKYTRQSSSFVFPDGTYGSEGFKKYIDPKTLLIHEKYRAEIKKKLKILSSKMYITIKSILKNPSKLIFVYSDFVRGSGAILFGALLNLFGFKRATGLEKTADKTLRRYTLITSETSSDRQIERLKNIFNNPTNASGDLIQVFIASRVVGFGITLKRVSQVHILTPHWNLSAIDQATGRCLRLDSHIDMIDPEVQIYRHVGVVKKSDTNQYSSHKTIDIEIYKIAEEKDIKDHEIYRPVKEMAIDCGLAYNRNVLKTDKDGSRECDYQNCNYKCYGMGALKEQNYTIDPELLDSSTYNLLYSGHEIEEIKTEILTLFTRQKLFFIKLEDLYKYLTDHTPFVILQAINSLISSKTTIRNTYGIPSYINENNGLIFLDTDIGTGKNISDIFYVENPYIVKSIPLEQVVDTTELKIDQYLLKTASLETEEEVRILLEQLHARGKITLLEMAYSVTKNKELDKKLKLKAQRVLKIMGKNLYEFKEGTAHKMYIEIYKGRGYNISKTTMDVSGKMRIWDRNKWRYATIEEEEKFNQLVKDRIEEMRTGEWFNEGNTWDFIGIESSKDGKFRIVEKLPPTQKRQGTGRVCGTIPKLTLIDYLLKIDFEPSQELYNQYGINKFEREVLIQKLRKLKNINPDYLTDIERKSFSYIKKLALVYNTSIKSVELCDLLKEALNQKGYLFEN
jgi:hypothetical protein